MPLRILGENQIRHLFRVFHGIFPAAQAGLAECPDALRVVFQFPFSCKQGVSIKIDTGGTRRVDLIREPGAIKIVGLVGGIARNRINLAAD